MFMIYKALHCCSNPIAMVWMNNVLNYFAVEIRAKPDPTTEAPPGNGGTGGDGGTGGGASGTGNGGRGGHGGSGGDADGPGDGGDGGVGGDGGFSEGAGNAGRGGHGGDGGNGSNAYSFYIIVLQEIAYMFMLAYVSYCNIHNNRKVTLYLTWLNVVIYVPIQGTVCNHYECAYTYIDNTKWIVCTTNNNNDNNNDNDNDNDNDTPTTTTTTNNNNRFCLNHPLYLTAVGCFCWNIWSYNTYWWMMNLCGDIVLCSEIYFRLYGGSSAIKCW